MSQKPMQLPSSSSLSLTFDLLTPKLLGFRDSAWNISTSSLVIAAAAFLRYRAEKKQTKTRNGENLIPATAVNVGNLFIYLFQ